MNITPGTGATINSTILERHFYASACMISDLQKNSSVNQIGGNLVEIEVAETTSTLTVTWDIPIARTIAANGSISESADTSRFIIPANTFTQGTGGTIVSSNLLAYFLECCERLEAGEKVGTTGINRITNLLVDVEALRKRGSLNLNYTASVSAAGDRTIQVSAYL